MVPLSTAAPINARKPGFSALIFPDVQTPTGNSADYQQAAAGDISRMGLVSRTKGIFYGPATMGRGADRTTMAVVAEANDDAGRFLRIVVGSRPLSGSVTQAAKNFGAILLRDGSTHATAQLPPFESDEYAVFAFTKTAILTNKE